jgi:hypothetical protein
VELITTPIIAIASLVIGAVRGLDQEIWAFAGKFSGRFTDWQEELSKDSRDRGFSERVLGQHSEKRSASDITVDWPAFIWPLSSRP